MIDRTTKLRWRRRLRRSKRQVEDIGSQAENHLDRHLFRRLSKIPGILRFTLGWILLLVLLSSLAVLQIRAVDKHYLTETPIPGGIYTEGMLGNLTNVNPIYASGVVDNSASRLMFAGLLRLDQDNTVKGDLAKSWTVDKTERVYTVKLRENLTWHDGAPLSAEDVVFTFQTIQNPDAKSPLITGWQGIQIKAVDRHTVTFTLPNGLSSFPLSLTTGLLPKHLLGRVAPEQLRSVSFNTSAPVGAGPFKFDAVEVRGQSKETREIQIAFSPFDNYASGKPKLNKFIIKAFHDEKRLLESFDKHELSAIAGLSSLPYGLVDSPSVYDYNIPLFSQVLTFFKTTAPVLSDVKVRQALVMGADIGELVANLGYPVALSDGPILKQHIGYNPKLVQLGYNQQSANKLLDDAGWKLGSDGIREKGGQKLMFTLTTQDDRDYAVIAHELKKKWRLVGADVQIVELSQVELQPNLASHSYDALLYGIELGVDPDVFAYWSSTQADVRSARRFNFSEYKSKVADAALEAGRTRLDPKLRAVKYQPFLSAWRQDAPALAIYQPRFLYVTKGKLYNFDPTTISSGVGRYANVHNWMIREAKLPM